MALNDALKELYTYNPIEQVQYDTVTISHSEFSQTYNLVKGNQNLTLGGVLYTASGFTFTLPEKGGNQQDLSFSIDNVESDIINELESALNTPEEAISFTYRIFISTEPTVVQFELSLQLQEITFNQFSIDGRATNINLFDSTFPRQRFDSWKFTGLTI